MSEEPQIIWVTKSVLSNGKIEKILAYPIPTTTDWIGASGRWRHLRIDSYYVCASEEEALKKAKSSVRTQIESNAARNEFLSGIAFDVEDCTEEELVS